MLSHFFTSSSPSHHAVPFPLGEHEDLLTKVVNSDRVKAKVNISPERQCILMITGAEVNTSCYILLGESYERD